MKRAVKLEPGDEHGAEEGYIRKAAPKEQVQNK